MAPPQPMNPVTVNGREYRHPSREPYRPVVVVCIDGCEPEYLDDALARGLLPNLARFRSRGFYAQADCVIPSFTNPNNLSIVTGVLPEVHGISGNFFLDPDSGDEVMMNDPRFLMCESLLAAFSRAGASVAIVTAKDKLRRLLGHGVVDGVCFSAEKAHEATLAEHGIEDVNAKLGRETPDVYSAALSETVMDAGVWLLENIRPDLLYLSTTDYIQHKHPPGDPVSDRFLVALDTAWGQLDAAGAVVGLTADHGMNAKHSPDGAPNVIYLEPLLAGWQGLEELGLEKLSAGQTRVILPITDPYVAHHGALGGFATIYLGDPGGDSETAPEVAEEVAAKLREIPGVDYAGTRAAACEKFGLPPGRIGDVVVVSGRDTVLGKAPESHDLSQLEVGLRSHGGLSEGRVPFVLNRPLNAERYAQAEQRAHTKKRLRNFDLFEFALNGVD